MPEYYRHHYGDRTLPEETPEQKAARLMEDMRRIKQRNRLSQHSFSNPKEH